MSSICARIVIVAFQSGEHLQVCIDKLASQSIRNFEAVIVNNDCPDDCTAALKLPDDRFRVLHAPENLGFAGGSNFGAKDATAGWIITLNPDAWPQTRWLERLMSAGETHPKATMLSSTLLKSESPDIVDGFGDAYSIFGIAWRGGHNSQTASLPATDVSVFGPCGAAAAYRKEAFEAVGGFDRKFFCYLEDVDLAIRLRRQGGSCIQVRQAEVLHYGAGSTGKESDFQYFQTYKNNLRMIIKTAPLAILPLQLAAYMLSQSYILFRNRKNKGASARLSGLKEGIRRIPQAFRDRAETQRHFTSGSLSFARKIAWHPAKVSELAILCWPTNGSRKPKF